MDDETLARLLQAQEDAAAAAATQRAAAAAQLRGSHDGQQRLISLVEDAGRKAQQFEDEMAQACALSVIPVDNLIAAAQEAADVSRAMGEELPLAQQDALAQELLAWFKKDFFQWVNSPPCSACGSTTQAQGTVASNAEEAGHGAGRTELFGCLQCATVTRFPRYNDPVKLLETRRGRCGEWANCFTLCCRAVGLEARLAVDLLDHVWTEVWSEAQQRWVHLDPCEAAYDKPLLYEAGWGKRLSYVVAVGRHGAVDVTRRYSRDYADTLRRRGLVLESWLADYLRYATSRQRASLPQGERQVLEAQDALDQQSLAAAERGLLSAALQQALPARTTGDAAWLAARGEDGSGVQQAKGAAAAVPPPGTRYRLAKDEGLAAMQPRRLCGGAVRASGENAPSETAIAAADGNTHSKWLDFSGKHGNAWLEYRLPAEQPPHVLDSYALTSANDEPARDPRHVVLEAYREDTSGWVVLDERRDLRFTQRHQRMLLQLSSTGTSSGAGSGSGASEPAAVELLASAAPPASRRFRLRVVSVADPAAANSVQLACLDLYGQPEQQTQQSQQQESQPQKAQQPQQAEQLRQGQQWHPANEAQTVEPPAAELAALAVQGGGEGDDTKDRQSQNPWAQLFAPQ